MQAIDVRELAEQAAEIVRRVHEEGATIDVVDGGRVVAHLVPAKPTTEGELPLAKVTPEEIAASLALLDELDRIAKRLTWPEGVSAVEAVRDVRREL